MSELFYTIGQTFGVIGFFMLSFLIFSGDTARFWNRFVGLDKIIKFQRKFSYFVAFFVIFHPIFFTLANGFNKNFIIPNFAYIPLSIGVIAMYIFIGIMIASKLYKMISYKSWQYIHVLTYVLFFFALFHAFNAGSNSNTLFIPYMIAFAAVIVGTIYRTQYKIRSIKTSKFKIKKHITGNI